LENDDRIKDIHNGSPSTRVKIRCLDKLNEYGMSPDKLIVMINRKRVDTIVEEPLIEEVNVRIS
jgi:hypothetical protein